jgi:phosphohistidine phosphatase SixA
VEEADYCPFYVPIMSCEDAALGAQLTNTSHAESRGQVFGARSLCLTSTLNNDDSGRWVPLCAVGPRVSASGVEDAERRLAPPAHLRRRADHSKRAGVCAPQAGQCERRVLSDGMRAQDTLHGGFNCPQRRHPRQHHLLLPRLWCEPVSARHQGASGVPRRRLLLRHLRYVPSKSVPLCRHILVNSTPLKSAPPSQGTAARSVT